MNKAVQQVSSRIIWVDIAKALLITLVVIGHTNSPCNRYIYVFHMSAFFLMSGLTAKLDDTPLNTFLKNRFIGLIIPFIAVNLLFFGMRYLLSLTSFESIFYAKSYSFQSMKTGLYLFMKMLYTVDLGGATWFLPVLFEASLIAFIFRKLVIRFKWNNYVIIFFSLVVYVIAFFCYQNKIILRYYLDLAFQAQFFFILGFYIKDRNIPSGLTNNKVKTLLTIIAVSVFLVLINNFYLSRAWPIRKFIHPVYESGNPVLLFLIPVLSVLVCCSALYLIYILSLLLERIEIVKRGMVHLGNRTISILLFNFIVMRILIYFFYLMNIFGSEAVKKVTMSYRNYWHIFSLLVIIAIMLLDYLIRRNRILSFLFLGSRETK